MPFTITQLPNRDKLCKTFTLPMLERLSSGEVVTELIEAFHHKRTRARKLTMIVVVYVLICWTLFVGSTLGAVYAELCSSERYLAEQDPEELASTEDWPVRDIRRNSRYGRKAVRCKVLPSLIKEIV